MPAPGRYPTSPQVLLLTEYATIGRELAADPSAVERFTDVSLGEALAEADASGAAVGSGKLVSAWRAGTLPTMTLGAVEVLVDHVGRGTRHAQRLVDALIRPWGFRSVPLAPRTAGAGDVALAAMGLSGSLGTALEEARRALADGQLTPLERRRIAAELDRHAREVNALRDQIADDAA